LGIGSKGETYSITGHGKSNTSLLLNNEGFHQQSMAGKWQSNSSSTTGSPSIYNNATTPGLLINPKTLLGVGIGADATTGGKFTRTGLGILNNIIPENGKNTRKS